MRAGWAQEGPDWNEIIEEGEDVLEYTVCFNNDQLLVCMLRHASHHLRIHKLQSGELIRHLTLPALGTISGKFAKFEFQMTYCLRVLLMQGWEGEGRTRTCFTAMFHFCIRALSFGCNQARTSSL